MPQTIKKDDGTEEEVYSKDELAAAEIKAVEGLKVELSDKEKELIQTKEDLNKAGDKDENVGKLRQKIADLEVKIGDTKNAISEEVSKVTESFLGDKRENLIKKLAGTDEELSKKIKHHMATTLKTMPVGTESELVTKIESAYKLSTNNPVPDFLSNAAVGSGGATGPAIKNESGTEVSTELKIFGKKFGITDDDWKKHGGKK